MTKGNFSAVKIGDVVSIPNGTYKGSKYIVRYIEDETILGKLAEYLNHDDRRYHGPEFRVANYRLWSL